MIFDAFRRGSSICYIVAFLGNPGPKYSGTRHNAGFAAGDECARMLGLRIDRLRFKALTAAGEVGGQKVLFMKPQTYMNLSGDAVRQAAAFYKVKPENIIVVSDEVSMPLGKLRIRRSGSAGGHNGLKDIIAKLGSDAFPRIRIGVGSPPHADYDMADWVLSSFKGKEAEEMAEAAHRAAEAVICYIENGADKAMNLYN